MSVYTDGSCLKPNGPSGWAFYISDDEARDWVVSGGEAKSTNNRMEMTAVIEALKFVSGKNYTIYTDSKLVINCAQKFWKRNKNRDLWDIYDIVSEDKVLSWEWVKGHSGNKYNELVDDAARKEARKF